MSRALRARVVFTLHVRVRICMWLEICCDPLPRYIAVPSLKSQISGPIGTALDSSSLIPLILLSAAIGRRPPAPRPPLAAIDVPWELQHLANGEVPRILSRRRRRRSTKRELPLSLSLSLAVSVTWRDGEEKEEGIRVRMANVIDGGCAWR